MYKTVAEVETALAQRIDGDKVKEVKGPGGTFSYIAWNDTSRALDEVFGPFGWSEKVVGQHSDSKAGVYSVTRELTGYATDTDGSVRTITRTAVGRAVVAGDSLRAHDTAMAAADSDSFSRAAKKLGDAFGLFLYEKAESHQSQSESPRKPAASSSSSRGDDIRPSDKQLYALKQAGFSEAEVDDMPFKEWKATLDKYFEGGRKPLKKAGKPAAKPAKSFVEEDEDEADY